jgi:hypothetical protein
MDWMRLMIMTLQDLALIAARHAGMSIEYSRETGGFDWVGSVGVGICAISEQGGAATRIGEQPQLAENWQRARTKEVKGSRESQRERSALRAGFLFRS